MKSLIDEKLLDKEVFVFFYSDDCHFCNKQKPIIDEIEQKFIEECHLRNINTILVNILNL